MDGVTIIKDNEHCVFYVERFSDELEDAIRKNLRAICLGEADSKSSYSLYSYKTTLLELLRRYESKTNDQQIGMIGEFLVHILIREELKNFSIDSPYFNLEEGSVKKGFDIVMDELPNNELWLTEVKSGNIHKSKTATQTIDDLLNTAKRDLNSRLNDTTGKSTQLWLNAIHSAKIALDNNQDKKKAIVSILENSSVLACSSSINVILVGNLFHDLSIDKFDETKIKDKKTAIASESLFNNVFVIATQKSTHDAIYNFLKSESKS